MSFNWVPGPIAWIVLRAASLVPKPVCYRLEEEWRPELWIPFFKNRARTREEAFTWLERLRRGLRADDGAQLQAWLKRRSHRKCIARAAADKNSPEHLAFLGEICELNPEWVEARRGRRCRLCTSFYLRVRLSSLWAQPIPVTGIRCDMWVCQTEHRWS